MPRSARSLLVLAALTLGCAPGANVEPNDLDLDAPLSPNTLRDGAPPNEMLPEEGKADATYPAQFDLVDTQSPVKSQGRRGVCSIFATAALMEHLYELEGSIPDPDFSEQYLQWSVKTQVMAFTMTDGSSAERNLQAINRFGIPLESAWPYEAVGWGASNDARCTGGENLPTVCYTNGEPPAAARMGTLYRLPPGRFLNSRARSIKGHMTTKRTAVVVGGDFFYQAWNHGGSRLPVNREYFRQGYVLYPNDADKTDSRMRPAGHAYLLVGWDDTLRVQRRDGMGNAVVDAMGMPVYDTGFFLFKNSWGTGSFGAANVHGAGYGWISYRYIEEFTTAYVSDKPVVTPPAEICNDSIDNDRDMRTDCMDTECTMSPACVQPASNTTTHEFTTATNIPDNTPAGVRATVTVAPGGTISALSVAVDITHPYRGDLVVKLVRGTTQVVLLDRQGGGDDDVRQTFSVPNFAGTDAAGEWTLQVVDTARSDAGRINRFALTVVRGMAGVTPPAPVRAENTMAGAIPDNNLTGLSRDVTVSQTGMIRGLSVTVDATHPYRGDLRIRLRKVGGAETVLLAPDASDADNVQQTFAVDAYNGQDMAGTWRLVVSDEARGDTGTLNFWRLEVTR